MKHNNLRHVGSKNATKLSFNNKQFNIVKPLEKDSKTELMSNVNVLEIKSLMLPEDYNNDNPTAICTVVNDKIKRTILKLSDEGLVLLYNALHLHFNNLGNLYGDKKIINAINSKIDNV